ncbi:predicted protein [Meyerozyma guilliermondii ATCC 6260]|uniref:Cell wall protein n=1 Tax=Meyerozyma guilliermondii (strain ATCC 6260 / CBS 566 / DSM 6381 / JCM 1539 / NBRC 10279 / NRRL Y-324) TaxID=294746 RepID=A5DJ27_PICGU|nr:uncharacterized protein PGUG_03278 [Meyerozyma guilliermondii ATCC 6260]EDK39180.2 predicted protein [Meyerozyma guilliermondii ATCC 6260]
MVSIKYFALTAFATSLVSASPVQVTRRGFLSDLFHEVAETTGAIVHGVQDLEALAKTTFQDLKCAAENFTGTSKAPHTNGIEWYEDAEYLAGLILSSGPAEYIKNETIQTVEQIIEGAEAQGSEFVQELAGYIGLAPEAAALANETFPIVNYFAAAIVKAIAEEAIAIAKSPKTAHDADTFINLVIRFLEQAGISITTTAGTAILSEFGVGLLIGPAITTACKAGSVAANALTSLEACTLRSNVFSQVLSEAQILLQQC